MLRQVFSSPAVRSSARLAARPARLSRPQPFQTAPLISARTIQPSISRWYSSETEPASKEAAKENGESKQPADSQANGKEAEGQEALKKQLEAKEAEAKDWKDKYMRSVADFRNLQDRTQRDMKAARDFAIQNFAKDLVDSVDNFDRALATVPEDKIEAAKKSEHLQELVNLHDGLKMTEGILLQTLKKHGLERFDPNGEKFDPNEHEATFMTPMPDKTDKTVFHTQQKGFKLNGRVLRAAKVGVVKNN